MSRDTIAKVLDDIENSDLTKYVCASSKECFQWILQDKNSRFR